MTVGDLVPHSMIRSARMRRRSSQSSSAKRILVNGVAWPRLNVAAGDYEFRLLNGSDSCFYMLRVRNPVVTVHSSKRIAGFSIMLYHQRRRRHSGKQRIPQEIYG